MRPLLIDYFCCEGGAAQGYHDAGFEVIGIDHKPQPRYPFEFIQRAYDEVDPALVARAAALHGSPPCQGLTELNNDKSRHLNLIPQTRAMFQATGKPYTIENVRGARAHLIDPIALFGTMFDNHLVTSKGQRFDLSRERLFETNWGLQAPVDLRGHFYPIANVFGGHLRARGGEYRTGNGTGRTVDFPGEDRPALARQLMGMPWATMGGMSEAVPPSFTRYIGAQLLAQISQARAA